MVGACLSWPMAFLFGAIISPPDASAAATVTRKVGFPRRLQSILEGESLINDATALVCYRFALAALVTREFSLAESIGQFFVIGIGGIAVGLAFAVLMLKILVHIKRRHRRGIAHAGNRVWVLLYSRDAASFRCNCHSGWRIVRGPRVATMGDGGNSFGGKSTVGCSPAGSQRTRVYFDWAAAADDSEWS